MAHWTRLASWLNARAHIKTLNEHDSPWWELMPHRCIQQSNYRHNAFSHPNTFLGHALLEPVKSPVRQVWWGRTVDVDAHKANKVAGHDEHDDQQHRGDALVDAVHARPAQPYTSSFNQHTCRFSVTQCRH